MAAIRAGLMSFEDFEDRPQAHDPSPAGSHQAATNQVPSRNRVCPNRSSPTTPSTAGRWSVLQNRLRQRFPFLCALALLAGCSRADQANRVVVYTSVDDVYSRDIAERFRRQT